MSDASRAAAAPPVRLVHVFTVGDSLMFVRGQVGWMRERGIETSVVTSPGPLLDEFAAREGVPAAGVEMPRSVTPLRDLGALRRLVAVLRRVRPHIVHAHTPKGGLLGMAAARLAGVPVRVYHMRGLPMLSATGARRRLLRATERASCALAQRVICVSRSVRDVAVAEGIVPAGKVRVLLGGSGNGVDARGRFDGDADGAEARAALRAELGIPADAFVVGFVGRLVADKGVVELAEAWARVREALPGAHLLAVGPWEPQDPVPGAVRERLEADPRAHLPGRRPDVPALYRAMDVVALPTYREGFPNVLLEAAAMRLPAVATAVPGCVDALVDGVTGTLVPARDAGALADALLRYARDPELARRHGAQGRERVLREFAQERLWEELLAEYRALLDRAGQALPAGAARPLVRGSRPC
jgi:glycosyltransferase involved in cell wall biosynthesis